MAAKAMGDRAKAKARKQKILLAFLGVVLVLLLVIQGPKTLKMLQGTPAPPVVAAATTTTPSAVAPAASAVTPRTNPSSVSVRPATSSRNRLLKSVLAMLEAYDQARIRPY